MDFDEIRQECNSLNELFPTSLDGCNLDAFVKDVAKDRVLSDVFLKFRTEKEKSLSNNTYIIRDLEAFSDQFTPPLKVDPYRNFIATRTPKKDTIFINGKDEKLYWRNMFHFKEKRTYLEPCLKKVNEKGKTVFSRLHKTHKQLGFKKENVIGMCEPWKSLNFYTFVARNADGVECVQIFTKKGFGKVT